MQIQGFVVCTCLHGLEPFNFSPNLNVIATTLVPRWFARLLQNEKDGITVNL